MTLFDLPTETPLKLNGRILQHYNNNNISLFMWIMSNAQYTNVNNFKRVKQTHDDKHNTKQDGSWFISAEKELKKIFKLGESIIVGLINITMWGYSQKAFTFFIEWWWYIPINKQSLKKLQRIWNSLHYLSYSTKPKHDYALPQSVYDGIRTDSTMSMTITQNITSAI